MGFPIVIPLTAAPTTSNMNAVSSAEKHFIRVRPLLLDIEEGRLKEISYYLIGSTVSSNEIASEADLGLAPDSLFSSWVRLGKLLNLSQLPHPRSRSNSGVTTAMEPAHAWPAVCRYSQNGSFGS